MGQLDDHEMARQLLAIAERSDVEGRSEVELVQSLSLALRALHLRGFARIYPIREQYPATLQALLDRPAAQLDTQLDALADPHDFLRLPDLLDMISDEGLPCIAPRLHRGWQDKRQSCIEARRITVEAVGLKLLERQRRELLAGVALSNRLLALPGPTILDQRRAREALWLAIELAKRLAP